MSDILEQRLDAAETKPDSLEKSLQPENDENEDPQISSATKVKSVDRAENNETSNLEEKEETGEKSEISSKIKPASDETGAPISLPTSIPTPVFLKRKMSAKEAIDCTPKRMSTTKRRKEQKTFQDEEDTSSKCRLFDGDDSSSDSDSSL